MIRNIVKRNFKLYFRDYVAVFFSLLAVLIVIALYILFLSDLQVDSVNEQMNGQVSKSALSYLINSWILAGLLSITCVTSTLGAFGTMVNDREKKLIKDFKSSPLKRRIYPIANLITAFGVGVVISLIALVVYSLYIYIETGYCFSGEQFIKCIGILFLSAAMSACLMGFMVSFFATNSAFSSASLIVGTTIGFLNGLYVPMGSLPEKVQMVLTFLPFGHIASLFRQVLMVNSIDECFNGAPEEAVKEYVHNYGINLTWESNDISLSVSFIFICGVMIVSLLLLFMNYRRKKREL